MTRSNSLQPVARRSRPRPVTVSIKMDQLLRHAGPVSAGKCKFHADDWAMEWLYEDFTLWAQIKLHTDALAQMMRENEVLAQFNSNTNRKQLTLGLDSDPLSYLVNLMNKHNGQNRK